MRRQSRPFIVEGKQKRSPQKPSRSIWGDFDLSAAMAEATREVEEIELPNRQRVDSNSLSHDAEPLNQSTSEHPMADPERAESLEAAAEGAVKADTPETTKKTRRPRKAKAEATPPSRTNVGKAASEGNGAATSRGPRKVYSERERGQKLAQIERSAKGGATLKSSVKQAGISEQTYYAWKKASGPASTSDDLKDLIALEEENKRLKSMLAERLRNENAELKKRLGLN
ncbi:MAG: transposase [Mesorhizobium sp.]|uniref:transposase n=1 Tax=Mesorhizobium sp. TaxID=1871066 RepID=UPI000FEA32A3|nr:transposase [Mesorhizobium sp.]RWD49603.1 MAG: transposase [Mesorhizobium sp.]RWE58638.1 MAG: transposase [Mesorhizobium sp.]RWF09039.1 MAG: transposase [Mesorhizobium sp.]RWF19224.1 MAG: transposase [Mesorhizobium sp.]TIY07020.1 MAG: transposase [Mesorhizobium sp.]